MKILLSLSAAASLFCYHPAAAVPKGSGGQTCESVSTARKDGKDDQGSKVNCLWDTCTFTECSTTGGQIGNCVRKTEYSNPRDCKAAARTGVLGGTSVLKNGAKIQLQQ